MASVQLHRHPLLRHPLTTYPVRGWTPPPGTGEPDTNEDTSERGPADLNTLPLTQQLTQMGVAGAPVAGAGQVYGLVITLSGMALAGLRPRLS